MRKIRKNKILLKLVKNVHVISVLMEKISTSVLNVEAKVYVSIAEKNEDAKIVKEVNYVNTTS